MLRGRHLAALSIGAFSLFACARVVPVAPPAHAPAVVRGWVVPDNTLAVDLAGAQVLVGGEAAVVGPDNVFFLPRPAPGKHSVVVEKRYPAGAVRRVMGIAMVYLSEGAAEVRVKVRDATDIDAFCSDCHPVKGKATRRDQVIRDVHPSGVVPVKAKKPFGRYDDRGRVTCESCHSPHRETGLPHFVVASFRDGKLCLQCH